MLEVVYINFLLDETVDCSARFVITVHPLQEAHALALFLHLLKLVEFRLYVRILHHEQSVEDLACDLVWLMDHGL